MAYRGGKLWSSVIDGDGRWRKRKESPHLGVQSMAMMWQAMWYTIQVFVGLAYATMQTGAHSAHYYRTPPDIPST